MKLPKYCTFIKSEIDYLIENCNFTPKELEYFRLRTQDYSNVYIAQKMNVFESNVSYIAKKVKTKILKVL